MIPLLHKLNIKYARAGMSEYVKYTIVAEKINKGQELLTGSLSKPCHGLDASDACLALFCG